ncbi:MAG: hypothetical protein ACE5F9_13960 [Phycisphaerae bacterium]
MNALDWQLITTVLAGISALTGVPLTIVVFYLRAIREDQRSTLAGIARRVAIVEADRRCTDRAISDIERSYTTRAEWVRENMLARKQLARLTELLARVETELESSRGVATRFIRSTHAVIALTERLVRQDEIRARHGSPPEPRSSPAPSESPHARRAPPPVMAAPDGRTNTTGRRSQ